MFYSKVNELIKQLRAAKTQRNDFGKYNYRSCEDILEAVKPLLPEGYIINITDEITMIGDRYYVKATAAIMGDDNHLESVAYAREPESKKGMDESQITGAASSYARKYALNGLLCIDDSKDPDTTMNADEMSSNLSKMIRRAKTLKYLDDMQNDPQVRKNMAAIRSTQESLADALKTQFNNKRKELENGQTQDNEQTTNV